MDGGVEKRNIKSHTMKEELTKVLTGNIGESPAAKEFLASQSLRVFFPSRSLTRRDSPFWAHHYFTLSQSVTESTINKVNDLAILHLEKKFTDRLLNLIVTENFEYGITSKSEILVKEQLQNNAAATKLWLNNIYVKNFNSPDIVIGILRIISRFENKIFSPIGQTIAIASLAHKNEEVVETAIRIFENWGGSESMEILKNVTIKSKWLDEYRDTVIKGIEEELCLS
jgi:hypothetical protein